MEGTTGSEKCRDSGHAGRRCFMYVCMLLDCVFYSYDVLLSMDWLLSGYRIM
jgi:hypothetical protein